MLGSSIHHRGTPHDESGLQISMQQRQSQTVLVESDCGVLTSRKDFQSESCSEHLPYVCRKMANASTTSTDGTLTPPPSLPAAPTTLKVR